MMPNSNFKLFTSYTPSKRYLISSGVLLFVAFFTCRLTGAGLLPEGTESSSLAARSGSNESKPFGLLPPNRTGIDFVHHWMPPESLPFIYSQAFMGCGVALGDTDGDGRPDLYLSRAKGGGRLYRNLGSFRFEDVTEAAGVKDDEYWGMSASFADVNNDGSLDLYVCGYNAPNKLFINQGDGTFNDEAAAYGLDFKGASVFMAFSDYDLDGDLDGYLLTNHIHGNEENDSTDWMHRRMKIHDGRLAFEEGYREQGYIIYRPGMRQYNFIRAGQYDHLFRNDGNGAFTDVTRESGLSGNYYGLSATWWDYNGDGKPDLYVANDYAGPDALYRNNGDGTFTDVIEASVPHTPWYSMGSNVADLNNDGLFDYMGSDMSGSNHFKQKMGMGDMEKNGWFLTYPAPRQYMRNALYVNTGSGRFMEAAYLAGLADTDWTWSIKFADLDSDGWEDLFVTTGMSRDWMNSDLVNQSRGLVNTWGLWRSQPARSEPNFAFRNLGQLEFINVSEPWGLDYIGVSLGAALGDLDNDGDLDLVVNNFEEPPGVYRNNTEQGNLVKIRLVGTEGNRFGLGATVRIDTQRGQQSRYFTPYRGFASTDEPVIHFGLGDQATIDRLTVTWPGGREQTFESFPANRFYTITEPEGPAPVKEPLPAISALFAESDALDSMRHVEKPYDDFKRQPLLPNKLSQLGPGMAWGDVDGDGDEDVFLSGAAGRPGMLYINEGQGEFCWGPLEPFASDKAAEGMAPLFFDADGDHDLDLYVVNGGYEFEQNDPLLRDRLYLNDGSGRFTHAPDESLPDLREGGSCAVAADYDRDGDLDLFVGSRLIPGNFPATPRSTLLRNEGGRFVDATGGLVPGLVTSALWSDANGDGWLDLWVTREWGPVQLYRNDRGRLVDVTEEAGLADKSGWWNGIAAGDVDGDGDTDYVTTNFGLNTKYQATADKPVKAYHGDMDGSGRIRFVEAEYEGNTLYPVRGKSCSTAATPLLGERFETFSDFALASLQEVYTPKCLQEAQYLEANTLESGIWLNEGNGRFVFHALPRLAQISPGFGVSLEDVDGDRRLDLYLVQNFFAPQPETGHMDGGVSLLLRGGGDGSFHPVWPNQSGLIVPGDATGLSSADIDGNGWIDFAVAVNDGPVQTFLNLGHSENKILRVQLNGSEGNPTGIGALVRVQHTDGSKQVREIYAGSSYLSQSSRVLHFGAGPGVDAVEVRWPAGNTSRHPVRAGNDILTIEEPAGPEESDGIRGIVAGKEIAGYAGEAEYAAAHAELGQALSSRGRYEEAIAHYRKAVALDAESIEMQGVLGEVLRLNGQEADAVGHLEYALKLAPDYAPAHFILGRIRQGEGDLQAAKRHFELVLRQDGEHAGSHYHLGFVLEEKGMLDASHEHFSHALRIDPEYGVETHFNFGRMYDAKNKLGAARNRYRLAALADPGDAEALNNLGSVCVRQGDLEEGVDYLRRAVRSTPGNAAIHQNLGTALMALDRAQEALASYRLAAKLDPDNYIAHSRLGFLLFKDGETRQALGHFRQAVRLEPDALESLNGAAWILATHHNPAVRNVTEAVRLAEHACKLAEYKSALLLDTLAAAYAASGQFERAVQSMHSAIQLDAATSGGKADEFRERLALFRQRKAYVNAAAP
jgi:tetratricopeptide (TPR) repeat protein